jgi:hypothetical protein
MKPIARIDSTLIAEVKRRVVHVRLHARETANFLGVACSPAEAWAEYDRDESARLLVLDDGCWSLRISDDRWYALYPVEMPLFDQPGRPPEGPEVDPEVLETVLIEQVGPGAAREVFAKLDTALALAKLDDPLECVCAERDEPVTPDVLTCGTCGRSWCNRCHPTPAARCPSEYDHPEPQPEPEPRLRWEAGSQRGVIGVTEEETVKLVLDGEPLIGLDLKAGTVVTWPNGEEEEPDVLDWFQRPKLNGFGVKTDQLPRLTVVTPDSDAEVIPLRPPTT